MVTRLLLGDFTIYSFVENRMHLDGGAMFGVIPKKLWKREIECDEQNLIPMDLNLLVVQAHGKNFLVDTGCGDVATPKERKIYGVPEGTHLESGLTQCGLKPEDIDFVLLSHLHFDHSGGGLRRLEDGTVVTRFPNARYLVSRPEWSDARNPNERTAATYIREYIDAYAASNQIDTVEGLTEIFPGITLRPTGGHTRGHQAVVVSSGAHALGYYADLFPTAVHLRTAWVAAVDLEPLETMRVKKQVLSACADDAIWVAFDHDLDLKFARVEREGGAFRARPLPQELLEVLP